MEAYETIVHARRSDQQFVSVPKYTSHNQITKILLKEGVYEDRALLSLLHAGEYIGRFHSRSRMAVVFCRTLLKETGI